MSHLHRPPFSRWNLLRSPLSSPSSAIFHASLFNFPLSPSLYLPQNSQTDRPHKKHRQITITRTSSAHSLVTYSTAPRSIVTSLPAGLSDAVSFFLPPWTWGFRFVLYIFSFPLTMLAVALFGCEGLDCTVVESKMPSWTKMHRFVRCSLPHQMRCASITCDEVLSKQAYTLKVSNAIPQVLIVRHIVATTCSPQKLRLMQIPNHCSLSPTTPWCLPTPQPRSYPLQHHARCPEARGIPPSSPARRPGLSQPSHVSCS